MDNVAETIKTLRARRKLTQAELAQKAALSRGYLIRLEAGKQYPTLGVLRRLAAALNVSITRLVR
jgi:transcriptional regulator with XRE-family HTH domain